jgi:hypothetical protein
MSTVTLRLNKRLLEDVRAYLLSQDIEIREKNWSPIVNKALSLFVYGHENYKTGQEMLKQHLESVGATEQDYLKGKVKTWARKSLYMQDAETADEIEQDDKRSVLQDRLNEVLIEMNQLNDRFDVPDCIERDEPEVITSPDDNCSIPPWERIDMVSWEKVLGLYPERNPNPLVNWADKDPLAKYAVRAALAQLPPPSHKKEVAKRLSKELYLRFIEWEEKHGRED